MKKAPVRQNSFAALRTEGYVLLAALLTRPPTEERLLLLADLTWDPDLPEKLAEALRALSRSGSRFSPAELEEEFHCLFVGLGSGELVPYASWYRTGRLFAAPLVALRSALPALGIFRQEDCPEPEDHAAALCEIMALVSGNPEVSPAAQAEFFRQHLAPWLPIFFEDLQTTPVSEFYRRVGRFGLCFLECENGYWKGFGGFPDDPT